MTSDVLTAMKLPFCCIVCKKELESVHDPEKNYPHDAVVFTSPGQYGSTVFDEMDGSKLEVNVCDECIKEAATAGLVGYWPGFPKRKMQPFDPNKH